MKQSLSLAAQAACAVIVLLAADAPRAQPASAAIRVPDTMAQRALACTGCHGSQGRASPDGYVPRLAGKPSGYLMAQLQAFRDGRRVHEGMSALLQPLDDGMLQALAEYFAELSVPYPRPAHKGLTEQDAARAMKLLTKGDHGRVPACSACHGDALTGVAPHVPGLLGLPADYLVAQIGSWRTGHRKARAPDCMAEVARRLTAEEVGLVARWLASQPVPTAAAATDSVSRDWPLECGGIAR